jgi:hypothetical protein
MNLRVFGAPGVRIVKSERDELRGSAPLNWEMI